MTEAAYLADSAAAYERSFTAHVIARPPGAIVLDRTFFYPLGGGQPADHGWLETSEGGRIPVTDVRRSGAAILHTVGRAPPGTALPNPGEEVRGEIDWERRFGHMRLHSGQHLVSALLFARTGLRTSGATLDRGRARLDLEGPWPSDVPWAACAESIHAELAIPRPIRIAFVSRAEWDAHPSPRSGAVSLAPHVDPVRVIEIGEVDRCPCGGTHLRSTTEIGAIDFRPLAAQPGGARVEFTLRGDAAHSERVTP